MEALSFTVAITIDSQFTFFHFFHFTAFLAGHSVQDGNIRSGIICLFSTVKPAPHEYVIRTDQP